MDFFKKPIWLLVVFIFCSSGMLYAMDRYKELFLQRMGDEDASPAMQENFARVVSAYRKNGWFVPKTIALKQMHDGAVQELKKDGTIVPNMINNGLDLVHTTDDHAHLTDREKEQLMAHEVAHLMLREHKWLNPHWYVAKYAHPITMGVVVMGTFFGTVIKGALGKKKAAVLLAACGSFYGASCYKLYENARDTIRFAQVVDNQLTFGIEFGSAKKLEEIECDLIAALVMQDGGKHGASLYQRNLEFHGDKNGVDGSHPYLSTRVKYHKVIEWIQEHVKDKT